MVRAYQLVLAAPAAAIHGKAFNVGFQNRSVEDIAFLVRDTLGDKGIALEYVPTDDNRSYHINSDKVRAELGFVPQYTIEDAVRSLAEPYRAGRIPNPMTEARYYNIKTMQQLKIPAPGKVAGNGNV
jgi:nucleoside-diphosphate-sugar epimerase